MNRLFLVAITGECCMFYLHGIKPRYNPFSLLKREALKAGVKLPAKHVPCLEWLQKTFIENGIEPHRLLKIALEKAEKDKQPKTETPKS